MLFPILLQMKAEVSFTQLLFGLKIIMLNYLQNSDKIFHLLLLLSVFCLLFFPIVKVLAPKQYLVDIYAYSLI